MLRKAKWLCSLVGVLACSAYGVTGAHAASFTSASGTYPVSVSGTSPDDTLDMLGSAWTCSATFTGGLAAAGEELALTPNLSCSGFYSTTAKSPAGALVLTPSGTVHVAKEIQTHLYSSANHMTAVCTVHIPPQTGSSTVTYANNADAVGGTIGGLTGIQTRNSILCPAGNHIGISYTIKGIGFKLGGTSGGEGAVIHVK